MLYGNFIESKEQKIKLTDVDHDAFRMTLDIWCGKQIRAEMVLDDVKKLASVADQFQMTEVSSALDETVLRHLEIKNCVEVLSWSSELGMKLSEAAAREMAMEQFEQLVKTEGFVQLNEVTLAKLLDDDGLVATSEEAVWEALVGWRRAGQEGQGRGSGLVEKIRFPLMEEGYLRSRVVGMSPAEEAEWMEDVVAEALRAKAARRDGKEFKFELLKALDDRGVKWGKYASGRGLRLEGHEEQLTSVVECEGRVCSGSWDGSILVWGTAAGAVNRRSGLRLEPADSLDAVLSLSVWKGFLISGHRTGKLKVWNVLTGALDHRY